MAKRMSIFDYFITAIFVIVFNAFKDIFNYSVRDEVIRYLMLDSSTFMTITIANLIANISITVLIFTLIYFVTKKKRK